MSQTREMEQTAVDELFYNLQTAKVTPSAIGLSACPTDGHFLLDFNSFTILTKDNVRIIVPDKIKESGILLEDNRVAYKLLYGRLILKRSSHVFYIFEAGTHDGFTRGVRICLPKYSKLSDFIFQREYYDWDFGLVQGGIYFHTYPKNVVLISRNPSGKYKVAYQGPDYQFFNKLGCDTILLFEGARVLIRTRSHYLSEKFDVHDAGTRFTAIESDNLTLLPNGLLCEGRWGYCNFIQPILEDAYPLRSMASSIWDWHETETQDIVLERRSDQSKLTILDATNFQEKELKFDCNYTYHGYVGPQMLSRLKKVPFSNILMGVYQVQENFVYKFSFHFFDVSGNGQFRESDLSFNKEYLEMGDFDFVEKYGAIYIVLNLVPHIHFRQYVKPNIVTFKLSIFPTKNELFTTLIEFIKRDPSTIVLSYLSDIIGKCLIEEVIDITPPSKNIYELLDYKQMLCTRREREEKHDEFSLEAREAKQVQLIEHSSSSNLFGLFCRKTQLPLTQSHSTVRPINAPKLVPMELSELKGAAFR